MNRIVTDMEAKEQKTPRSENSTELTECPRHVTSRNVNDGVKGSDTSPSPIGYVQRHHVALPELDAGSQAVRALDQLGREVDATNLNPVLVQVTSDMTRPAPQIAGRANVAHARSKTIEKLTIKRLVPQLIEDASDVFVRYSVVACLGVHAQ